MLAIAGTAEPPAQSLKRENTNGNSQQVAEGEARDAAATGKHETRQVSGWTLHIHRELLAAKPELTDRAFGLLQTQLEEIVQAVPPVAVAELQKVPLYFSPEYPGTRPRAEFHPAAGWLREHGRDPEMAKGVEFTNIGIFAAETRRMPNFALHELAHAYHNRVLPDGFANPAIRAAYEHAKASGNYEQVDRRDSKGQTRRDRAYALSDAMEYFAETSEAYFTRNDFYPFDREELREHDPRMFALLGKLWRVPSSMHDRRESQR